MIGRFPFVISKRPEEVRKWKMKNVEWHMANDSCSCLVPLLLSV